MEFFISLFLDSSLVAVICYSITNKEVLDPIKEIFYHISQAKNIILNSIGSFFSRLLNCFFCLSFWLSLMFFSYKNYVYGDFWSSDIRYVFGIMVTANLMNLAFLRIEEE